MLLASLLDFSEGYRLLQATGQCKNHVCRTIGCEDTMSGITYCQWLTVYASSTRLGVEWYKAISLASFFHSAGCIASCALSYFYSAGCIASPARDAIHPALWKKEGLDVRLWSYIMVVHTKLGMIVVMLRTMVLNNAMFVLCAVNEKPCQYISRHRDDWTDEG